MIRLIFENNRTNASSCQEKNTKIVQNYPEEFIMLLDQKFDFERGMKNRVGRKWCSFFAFSQCGKY